MTFEEYFNSNYDYFFQWEDEADVVAISYGDTIGYREYIAEILEKIAPNGLPRFASVLLFIIATNPNGKINLELILESFEEYFESDSVSDEAFRFLGFLEELPYYIKEKNNRIILFHLLFERSHNRLSINKSTSFVHKLKTKDFQIARMSNDVSRAHKEVRQDFRIFELLYKKFPDTASIINALSDLPSTENVTFELEEEVPKIRNATNLPDALIELNETFHVGTLLKHVWGGLNIPFHNSLPSQQPIGGFTDLTNKGDFDKLLISEFANDDSVFLSRLANNEALYFNREIPPQNNDRERIILIDVSIKNWGTPKTIAMAIALAISYHPKTDIHCTIFLVGDEAVSLEDKSIKGVIAGMEELSTALHPVLGLEKIKENFKLSAENDLFFITHEDVVTDREVQKFMLENKDFFKYLITTNVSGFVNVHQYKNKTKSFVQHFVLPLEEAWRKNFQSKKKPSSIQTRRPNYYPLLISTSSSFKARISTNGLGEYRIINQLEIVIAEGDLTQHGQKGWKYFYTSLSQKLSNQVEIGQNKMNQLIIATFNSGDNKLVLINVTTHKQKIVFLDGLVNRHELSVFFSSEDQHFYFLSKTNYKKFEVDDSKEIEVQSLNPSEAESAEAEYVKRVNAQINDNFAIPFPSVMRNIKQVFINTDNELVINTHVLDINQNETISLKQRKHKNLDVLIEAVTEDNSTFIFPNGNSIHFNRLGFMILSSENYTPLFEIQLLDSDADKLALVKILKQETSFGLGHCKEWVDNTPSTLKGKYDQADANRILNNIKKVIPKVKMEIIDCGKSNLYIPTIIDASIAFATETSFAGNDYFLPVDSEAHTLKISPTEMWAKEIIPFITEIIDYGA